MTTIYICKIVSEYDQEIPQSQTADNPVASRGRAAQPSRDTGRQIKQSNQISLPHQVCSEVKSACFSLQSEKEGKDQELKHSSTTLDPGYQWENDNFTNKAKRSALFPAGDHKALINRRTRQHSKTIQK